MRMIAVQMWLKLCCLHVLRACAGEEPDSDEESEEDSGVSKRC
jgi:hypothetical protein